LNGILCASEVLGTLAFSVLRARRCADVFNSARPVNATFGFSFAFGAPSFSDPSAAQEPPTKRRKTVAEVLLPTPPASTAPPSEAEQLLEGSETGRPAKKATKGRRRLPVDIAEEHPQPVQATGDDSFVAQAKPKKGRAKKKQAEPVVVYEDQEVAGPTVAPTKGRPERRAAADATAKVTDGFVEEAAPIDKKRQDPGTVAKPKRGRKRKAPTMEEEAVSIEVQSVTPDEILQAPEMVEVEPVKGGRRGVKKIKAHLRRGWKKAVTTVDVESDGAQVLESEEMVKEDAEQAEAITHAHATTPVTAIKRKREPSTHRQPLLETDINLLRPSVSPAKLDKELKDVERPKRAAGRPRKQAVAAEPRTTLRATKKRKMHVERDEVNADDAEAMSEENDEARAIRVPAAQQTPEVKGMKRRKVQAEPSEAAASRSDSPMEYGVDAVRAPETPSPRPAKARNAKATKRRKCEDVVDDADDNGNGAPTAHVAAPTDASPRDAVATTAIAHVTPPPRQQGRKGKGTKRGKHNTGDQDGNNHHAVDVAMGDVAQTPEPPQPAAQHEVTAGHPIPAPPVQQGAHAAESQALPEKKKPKMRIDPETGDPSRRETVRTVKHNTSPGLKRQLFKRGLPDIRETDIDDASVSSKSAAEEEDIDWLFASIEAKGSSKHSGKSKAAAKSQKREWKGSSKLADVDLDDLVTNIASFAGVPKAAAPSTAAELDEVAAIGSPVVVVKKAAKDRRRKQ